MKRRNGLWQIAALLLVMWSGDLGLRLWYFSLPLYIAGCYLLDIWADSDK